MAPPLSAGGSGGASGSLEPPAAQREAFLLQAEGGLSLAEIAQTTGVSTETAKSRLRYARARLRETLEAHA